MRIDGRAFRTIWLGADDASVEVINQRALCPHPSEHRLQRRIVGPRLRCLFRTA